ncbi:MAG: 4'-phosphopantetheinyl transferase superfamily protein [Oscillospiraceae bacterium]
MEIYAVEITNMPFQDYLKGLPSDIQMQLSRFRKREDALKKLYGELIIRKVIKQNLCIKDEHIDICRNEYGKPYLNGFPYFHYNISHSGNWVICAVEDFPIGIDIEQITDVDFDIVTQHFTQQESSYIFSQPVSRQATAFFELWTLKESYIKQIGMGLSIKLSDFSMIKTNLEWNVVSKIHTESLYFHQYDFTQQYEVAVCSAIKSFPENIIVLNGNSF